MMLSKPGSSSFVELLCSMERADDAQRLSSVINKKLPIGWTTVVSNEVDILLHGRGKKGKSDIVGIIVGSCVDAYRAAIYT